MEGSVQGSTSHEAALRKIRELALNMGRPETDDFAHRVFQIADAALSGRETSDV